MKNLGDNFFEEDYAEIQPIFFTNKKIDLDDILNDEPKQKVNITQTKSTYTKPNNKDIGFKNTTKMVDDDIQFFDDENDFFKDNREKSSTLQKFDKKVDQKAATTVDFNRSTLNKKKDDEFDDLLGPLDNKSSLKPSSNFSNRNMQGQYNKSQANFYSELNNDEDDDDQKKSYLGMTGMTVQTTVSRNEDFHPRQIQSQDNTRKNTQDYDFLDKKDDGFDVDQQQFSRRNLRRAETHKPPVTNTNTFQGDQTFGKSAEPISIPVQNKRLGDSGFSSARSKQKDDDNFFDEDEDLNKNQGYKQQFNQGQSFGFPKPQSNTPSAGGTYDQSQHNRVQSHQDYLSTDGSKNLQNYTKKQDQDDFTDDLSYNPTQTSRLAASKRPRTSQRENQSQPATTVHTLTNINQNQKQQYPRLMKSQEETQYANQNPNNILNEFAGNQQKQTKSQGNKNESSYNSDKDLFGASETNQGTQHFDDNFDQRFSRRSSNLRGENKNTGTPSQVPSQTGFFQQNNINQGGLSDVHDLKQSETNYQQNFGNNFGSDKSPPKYQQRQSNDDISAKTIKQMEEQLKTQRNQISSEYDETIKKMKSGYEDQIKYIKENYESLIKFERDRNQQLQDEIKDVIIKDRERQRQLFDIELENVKTQFEKEKSQISITNQLQNESLKKQLQQQAQVIGLAEQLKHNSDKLNLISHKIETTSEKNQIDMQRVNIEVEEKQKALKALEERLKLESEFIDTERKRLEKIRKDLAATEDNQKSYLEKEKSLIRIEYQRLTDLQDQIKELEVEKKRDYVHEQAKMESERLQLQEERIKLKQDYEKMYNELEVKATIFEQTKSELDKGQSKIENRQQQQIKEINERKQDLFKQEQYMTQKQKVLELRDYELKLQEHDYGEIFRQIKQEKIYCENEKKGLQILAEKVDQENNMIRQFKNNFDKERMRLQYKEQELQQKEVNIRRDQHKVLSEKRDVSQLQDTLKHLKSDFVKKLVASPAQTLGPSSSYQNYISPTKFDGTNRLGFRSPQFSTSYRHPLSNEISSPNYNNTRNYSKEAEREIAYREYEKNNGYNKQVSSNKFDLRGFMNSIKEVDLKQIDNMAYNMNEKDNLHSKRPNDRLHTFNNNQYSYSQSSYNQSGSERSVNAHSYVEN